MVCSPINQFHILTLNISATNHVHNIDWKECEIASLPVLSNVSTEKLKGLIKGSEVSSFRIPNFLCHIKAVDAWVKLVSESPSSLVALGLDARDTYMQAKIKSWNIMPSFDT